MCFDKGDMPLAKDVLQFVKEKVSYGAYQESRVFDVLIASIWLTFHSLDGSQTRSNLKDMTVLDKQIEILNSESADENNTIANTERKCIDEKETTVGNNVEKQIHQKAKSSKNDTGKNLDEKSEDKNEGLSEIHNKKDTNLKSSFSKQVINDNSSSDVQGEVKEANEETIEIESDDNDNDVVVIEDDVVTFQIEDNFTEDTYREIQVKNIAMESDDVSSYTVNGNNSADSNKAVVLMNDKEDELIVDNDSIMKCPEEREPNEAFGLRITNVRGGLSLSDCSVDIESNTEQSLSCHGNGDMLDNNDNEFTDQEQEKQDMYTPRSNILALPQTTEANHELMTNDKFFDEAKPNMIMSDIFNREAELSQWSDDDSAAGNPQNYEIITENVAEDNLFDSGNGKFESSTFCLSGQMSTGVVDFCTGSSLLPSALSTSLLSYPQFSFDTGTTCFPSIQNSVNIEIDKKSM